MNIQTWFHRPAVLLATGSVLLVASAGAQTVAHTALPLDTAVRTGKLSNGFTYFIRHNATPEKRVVMYLACKAGSILETEQQRGLAHFIEHMSFNGTTHFPKNELVDYLQKSGVRFGADLNAYTSFDETVYQLPLPADNKALLQNGLQIMRDWAQEATLETQEIEKERGVILEEARLGKGAQKRMQQQVMPMLMNNSRYAYRLPIGLDSVIQYAKPETLRQFYHDWYRPDLQALVVVGDVDVQEIEQQVKKLFGTLKNPAKEKARTQYRIPLTGKNQFKALTDAEITSSSVDVYIKLPNIELKTAADYRQAIVQQLLNQLLSQRLIEVSKQANAPFISATAGIQNYLNQLQLFAVHVDVNKGAWEKGVKAAWRELERAKRFGFTATEMNRAGKDYLASFEAAWKERSKARSDQYVKEYVDYFLHGTASPGIEKEYELVKALLPQITLAEIQARLLSALKTTDCDMVVAAPDSEKESLPTAAVITSWQQAVQQETLEAYKDAVVNKPLLAQKPVPGKIIATTQQSVAGVTEYTLSNGVKVVIKPTTFKKDEISFSAFAAGGTSLYNDADYPSASYATGVVAMGGVGPYNSTELGKYLSGKQLGVMPYIGERSQGFTGKATTEELETALQLVYLYCTAPRADAALFTNAINRSKASLANRFNDPASVFADTAAGVLGNYHLRRTGPSEAKLNQVNMNRALEIYKERFADASGFTFVFVGNIDTATIKPLLEIYLGSLPASHTNETAKDLGIRIPKGNISRAVYKGKEDKATVRLYCSGDYTYNEENNTRLQALSKVLGIRLIERLREEEGGVYAPAASVSFAKYPASGYMFSISFGCAPANVEKLIAATQDEMRKLRETGPDQVNLDKYKAETRTSLATAIQGNGYWMGYLANQYQLNEPLGDGMEQGRLVEALTVPVLQQAAKEFLKTDNFIRLVLLPEKGAE
ncbi:zinc protease [Filimonas lacunae]|uniref:Zinc protease n=1 Tax=Filimonas lacunae TaxID=477680 RepID=A0A173MH47_9BACT|nr:insulinase family protein [Filimonas lacunae]BAV06942.1 zinc protease PqqL [Filimonas lacunae]SIS97458.1 zinc protease [Filimonas lacunae]